MHNFYYTYKITLLKGSLAGHYYYGRHKTNNLNDGYAGSGKLVSDYYDKYGKIEHQTYIKEIIAFYTDDEELNIGEKEIIGDKYNTDPLCMNLCEGGTWGMLSDKSIEMMKLHHKDVSGKNNPMYGLRGENNPNFGSKRTEDQRKYMSKCQKNKHNNKGKNNPMYGRKGENNPVYGTHWKKDPETGKRIYYKNNE